MADVPNLGYVMTPEPAPFTDEDHEMRLKAPRARKGICELICYITTNRFNYVKGALNYMLVQQGERSLCWFCSLLRIKKLRKF